MGNGGTGNGYDGPLQPILSWGGKAIVPEFITNGTSNVLLIGDKNLPFPLVESSSNCDDDQGWTDGWDNDMIGGSYAWPNVPVPDWGQNYICGDLWGSVHASGINAVYCDGSVHQVSYSISVSTFAALCSINSGAILGSDAP